jgi:hypothetical protein
MNMQTLRRPAALLLGCLTLLWSGLASAEPPSRAARLGYISGTVSISPASQPDWVQAVVNLPLTTGDRLWADASSRAELQVGGAAIRLGADSSVTLLNLDDRIAQVQLSQGTLKIRVRHLAPEQSFEVDTPNLAFTIRRPGDYRIDVDANDDATAVSVQNGEAEVYGEGASYAVTPRQSYRFYGTGLSDYDALPVRRDDDLDRWARDRDRRADTSPSARYVSQEVVGYEDLDANGSWRADPTYGSVWTPTRVAAGWTPYHDGHWAWVDPWGWTWVDDAPWGFAVSHYGRWANFNGTWGWVPGPPREQAVYAPALVAFVGGKNFQVSVSVGSAVAAAVGWFPLAPREVYQPSYPVSRGYFDNINRSNAVIAPTTITNVYNTTIVNNTTNIVKTVYVNQQVSGAVVAVPAQAFAQSQSVARAAVPLSREAALSAPVAPVATVAPVQQSVHGGAPVALAKPPARELAVVAHTAPPPPPVPFAEQQKHLAANPGKPIDEAQRVQLKPAIVPGPEAKVSVIAAARAPAPAAPPPATAPAPKTPEARKADAARAEATVGGRPADDARSAAARADAAKAGAANADAAKAEAARAEAAKAEAMKADAAKAGAARTDAAKADAAKVEAAKTEATRADAAKADAARARGDAAKADATKAEAGRVEAAKAEAMKAEAAKADATRAAATRADLARTQAAKADAARNDAAKADAAKAEAAKAESARSAAAKADASRAEAAQAEAARANVAKAESAKAEAARAEAGKAETARAEAARGDAARAEANRAAAAKAEAGRAESAKAEAAKAAAARGEAARAEAARAEAARADAARAAQPKPTVAAPPPPRASSPRPGPDAKGDEEKKRAEEEPPKR